MFAKKFNTALFLCLAMACSAVLAQDLRQQRQVKKKESTAVEQIYRDPSVPLSIGEMVQIQQQKATEQFLRQAGFATDPALAPVPVPPVVQEPEPTDEMLTAMKIVPTMKVLAIYQMPDGAIYADVDLSGKILKVSEGHQLEESISVDEIHPDRIVVSHRSTTRAKGCKKKPCENLVVTHDVVVGHQIELSSQ